MFGIHVLAIPMQILQEEFSFNVESAPHFMIMLFH